MKMKKKTPLKIVSEAAISNVGKKGLQEGQDSSDNPRWKGRTPWAHPGERRRSKRRCNTFPRAALTQLESEAKNLSFLSS